jgi:hypothetical protein
MAFIKRHKPNRARVFAARNKHEIFLSLDEISEPGRCFVEIEVKRLHANSAHDFVQQLAHHHGDFMRIT